jgi:hypothetical protein
MGRGAGFGSPLFFSGGRCGDRLKRRPTMKVRALDQLHISRVQADTIFAGAEFDLPDDEAKKLSDRGLVEIVGGAKAAPAPNNKMAKAPANKRQSKA